MFETRLGSNHEQLTISRHLPELLDAVSVTLCRAYLNSGHASYGQQSVLEANDWPEAVPLDLMMGQMADLSFRFAR